MAQKLLFIKIMRSLSPIIIFSGCVFISPIDGSPEPSQEENFTPTADVTEIFPALTESPVTMSNPNLITFQLPILEDPNLEDTMTVRFYADGQNDFIENRIVTPSGDLIRTGILDFVLQGSKLAPFEDENGNLFGGHRLEVIISDRGFVADAGVGARQIPEGGRQNYYFWELFFP
jgi:hypothetical protein